MNHLSDWQEFEHIPKFRLLIRKMLQASSLEMPVDLTVGVTRKIAIHRCVYGFSIAGYVNLIIALIWGSLFHELNPIICFPAALIAQVYFFSFAGCAFLLVGLCLLRWPEAFLCRLPAIVSGYLIMGGVSAFLLTLAGGQAGAAKGVFAVLMSYLLTALYLYEQFGKCRSMIGFKVSMNETS